MEAQIAFARYGHAQRSVAEHLEPHRLSGWTADVFFHDGAVNLSHLVERELTCQHHHVGIGREEAHRLYVAHVELGGEGHPYPSGAGVGYGCDVRRYNGCESRLGGRVDYGAARGEVGIVEYGIDCEICLYAVFAADGGYGMEVVEGEVHRRARTHVEPFHAEVNGVGS